MAETRKQAVARVKAKYPHHVLMRNWEQRPRQYKDNLIQRRSDASWVEQKDTRTFGFLSKCDALSFARDYGGELLEEAK